jgi:hypothetical protein
MKNYLFNFYFIIFLYFILVLDLWVSNSRFGVTGCNLDDGVIGGICSNQTKYQQQLRLLPKQAQVPPPKLVQLRLLPKQVQPPPKPKPVQQPSLQLLPIQLPKPLQPPKLQLRLLPKPIQPPKLKLRLQAPPKFPQKPPQPQ